MKQFFAWCIAATLAISLRGCGQEAARRPVEEIPATPQIQTGMIAEQILPGADGDIIVIFCPKAMMADAHILW